jgi:SAM-dependent methyltransferase
MTTRDNYEEAIRRAEVDLVSAWMRPGQRVLEIGGAYGFQASLLAERGYQVTSIDVPGRPPRPQRFPVQDYDGRSIPAPDGAFDVVFSSNVLEHVRELPALLAEINRTLKPGGVAIHLLPSPSWRLWHSLVHPLFLLRFLLTRRRGAHGTTDEAVGADATVGGVVARHGLGKALRWALLGPLLPHGEYPNSLAELWYYSRPRWRGVFRRAGYAILHEDGNRLAYSGHGVFPGLSLAARRRLARVLGSSCHLFVLQPNGAGPR